MAATPLTAAEMRVLRYLPTHLSFEAIADELIVSRNTVKTQAIAAYRKLGVSSRAEAVEQAGGFACWTSRWLGPKHPAAREVPFRLPLRRNAARSSSSRSSWWQRSPT